MTSAGGRGRGGGGGGEWWRWVRMGGLGERLRVPDVRGTSADGLASTPHQAGLGGGAVGPGSPSTGRRVHKDMLWKGLWARGRSVWVAPNRAPPTHV